MKLAMSMFSTQADYWKARAELAEEVAEQFRESLEMLHDWSSMAAEHGDVLGQSVHAECVRVLGTKRQ